MKPRCGLVERRPDGTCLWRCEGGGVTGYGISWKFAFSQWLLAVGVEKAALDALYGKTMERRTG